MSISLIARYKACDVDFVPSGSHIEWFRSAAPVQVLNGSCHHFMKRVQKRYWTIGLQFRRISVYEWKRGWTGSEIQGSGNEATCRGLVSLSLFIV